jgi:hypothetical protein
LKKVNKMNAVRDMAVAYLIGGNVTDEANGNGLKDYAKDLGVHVGAAVAYWHMSDGFVD